MIAACFQWLSVSSYLIRPQRDTETRTSVYNTELRVPQEPTSVSVGSESGGKAGNISAERERGKFGEHKCGPQSRSERQVSHF